ncbi:unnamed protein product [Cyprideis torosa]|uniref:39S ribosomal protein L51, mitochondrial n=1 Tax=Cyprideis torosa TaxID=163714 RepID=A0A7R8ZHK7_9CRUS|nr:unnamed protein product [Cyprideis torosa]CAG0883974.1 unnamed protein product [Cyprideis torosa]
MMIGLTGLRSLAKLSLRPFLCAPPSANPALDHGRPPNSKSGLATVPPAVLPESGGTAAGPVAVPSAGPDRKKLLGNHQSSWSPCDPPALTRGVKRHKWRQKQVPYNLIDGSQDSDPDVLARFVRLDWGAWVHPYPGRFRKLYRKTGKIKSELRRFLIAGEELTHMLDSMVNEKWRKPRYYVDDPYERYHKRENFEITRRRPAFED